MADEPSLDELTEDELEAQEGEELPDRETMAVFQPDPTIPLPLGGEEGFAPYPEPKPIPGEPAPEPDSAEM
jgi:hypothetical protein